MQQTLVFKREESSSNACSTLKIVAENGEIAVSSIVFSHYHGVSDSLRTDFFLESGPNDSLSSFVSGNNTENYEV